MAKKPEADEDDEGAGAPQGGGKKKLIMMIVAGAVLIGALGGGYMWWSKRKAAAAAAAAAEAKAAELTKPKVFIDLPDLTINLSGAGERPQFLRAKIALEVDDQKVADAIKPQLPRVMDAFQLYLREMRVKDLEGSAGMYRIKDELMRRVNTAVYPSRISAVLFKEVLVQ